MNYSIDFHPNDAHSPDAISNFFLFSDREISNIKKLNETFKQMIRVSSEN